jgi:hypothetical protein
VAVKGDVDNDVGGEEFDGFITDVRGDGFPSVADVFLQLGEEQLHGAIGSVLSEV